MDGVIVGDGAVTEGKMEQEKAVEAKVVGGGGLVAPCDVPSIGKWHRTDESDDEGNSEEMLVTSLMLLIFFVYLMEYYTIKYKISIGPATTEAVN